MSDHTNFHQQNTQNIPSEPFGTVRNDSEAFGTVPNLSEELERVEKYSLTVREATRMFEEAGVPRTERSIVKWCTPNPHGVPRLMCRFDTNDRRWSITEESVRIAIAEEVAKQREIEARNPQAAEHGAQHDGHAERPMENEQRDQRDNRVFERAEIPSGGEIPTAEKDKIIRELEYKIRDEQIASRAKDMVINRMENEHMHLMDQVAKWSRQVGVLETRLLQIEGPKQTHSDVPNASEQHQDDQAREGIGSGSERNGGE
jgi:hypothetical protein